MPVFLPIALVGGLAAGGLAFQKRKPRPLIKMLAKHPPASGITTHPVYTRMRTSWDSLKAEQLSLFFNDSRGDQWQAISSINSVSADSAALTVANKEQQNVDHYLLMSTIALGLAGIGAVFPIVSLLSGGVTLYASIPVLQDALSALIKEGRLRWTVLDAIAILSTLLARYFVASALANVIFFVGMKMMLKTEDRSHQSIASIFGQQPQAVWILVDGVEVEIPFERLKVGDTLVVHTGQMIPIDGIIIAGTAAIDQHLLTGEAQPAEKGPGEPVFAATVLLAGRLEVLVEKTGVDTVAAQVREILTNTTDYRTAMQARWEKLADRSVLPTLGIAALALPLLRPVSAVAVLTSNFAPVLQVSSPLGMLNFLQRASQSGILIKDGRALEAVNAVDAIVFDKTGTLTLAQPHVSQLYPCADITADELLAHAAAVEAKQSHPLAQAILQAAAAHNLTLPPLEDARYTVGYGIQARIGERVIRVGSARYMALEGIALPETFQTYQEASQAQGASLVYVAFGEQLAGAIALQPTLRPEAKEMIQQLQARGLTAYIISGDHTAPTQALAAELGIDHYFAEVLPQEKARLIEQLQQEGRRVCFVGDGINDAIALKKADVAISLRGASSLATNTAQIILMDESLNQLGQLFELAQAYDKNLKTMLTTTFAPGLLSLGGIFFLHTGIHAAIFLYNLSMIAGFANGMLPAFQKPAHGKRVGI